MKELSIVLIKRTERVQANNQSSFPVIRAVRKWQDDGSGDRILPSRF